MTESFPDAAAGTRETVAPATVFPAESRTIPFQELAEYAGADRAKTRKNKDQHFRITPIGSPELNVIVHPKERFGLKLATKTIIYKMQKKLINRERLERAITVRAGGYI